MPVIRCSRYDTLHRILELLAAAGEHADRIVCVDEMGRCTGVVTITDIFAYFCNPKPIVWKPEQWPELSLSMQGGGAKNPNSNNNNTNSNNPNGLNNSNVGLIL